MSALKMPTTYVRPLGTPLYWRDEQTGLLPAAMQAYVFYGADPTLNRPPTARQLALVINYFRYVINAPCWRDSSGEVTRLRSLAAQMTTIEEIEQFIEDCLEIGIDPI
jgi:hypothetical protein